MGSNPFSNKGIVCVIIIAMIVPTIMIFTDLTGMGLHDTPLFTGVRFSATNNAQVLLADQVSPIFRDTRFDYYSLPYTVEIYGNQISLQYWFKERYQVNGTYEDFMHGPFDISISYLLHEPLVFELNKNNVTVTVLE